MISEHMLAAVLNMVNRYKYLPELIVIHVGASGFSRVTNHKIHINIKNMVLNCKKITTAACRSTDSFQGIMFSLMLSLPFYINWDSQRAARQARAHFSMGLRPSMPSLMGGYIIRHPDIAAAMDPGLYNPNNQGDLMKIGYLLMMKDITQKIQTIVAPFAVALAHRRQPMAMHNAIQATRSEGQSEIIHLHLGRQARQGVFQSK